MSGLPPFLGFWAKVAIINYLLYGLEYILALFAMGCGLYLMYFYLQNYRFNTGIIRNFTHNHIYLINKAVVTIILLCLGTLINFICIFFIVDL
jgi:NADH:ubiquinone oxidoreductase subunit 2 (subunit N)